MSIKFLYSREKTNSFRPVPWHWSTDPFPALRGEGARHRGFLAVARDYTPGAPEREGSGYGAAVNFDPTPSKLIRTQEKQTLLLVPCSPEQDEQIVLITLRGGFRGGYSRVKVEGGEILLNQSSNMHCCPTGHLIVRLTHPNGFVFAETGRRSSFGLVEIFSWSGIKEMPTEEFETWLADQAPDLSDASRAELKVKVEEDRKATAANAKAKASAETARKAEIERLKPLLCPRINAMSRRREAIGMEDAPVYGEESWSFGFGYPREYTEDAVTEAEDEVSAAETKHADKKAFEVGLEHLKPRLAAAEVVFYDDHTTFAAREQQEMYAKHFSYNPEGLQELITFLEAVEKKAREAKAKAEALASQAQLEVEAAASGLPGNVEIWKRRGGATNAGDGWVIMPNGMTREPDEMRCPRPRYPDEGTQVWRQIIAGELVLRWAKSYTAAPHEFDVIHRPMTLTPEQLRTVALLEEELATQWANCHGVSETTTSPSIGKGWNLTTASKPVTTPLTPKAESKPTTGGLDLSGLSSKFNVRKN